MIVTLNGTQFIIKDHPTMRFYKVMADVGKPPEEPLKTPDYMRWFVATFLDLDPTTLLDTRPDEVLAAFKAIQDVQSQVPFVASPDQAGAQPEAGSQPASTPSPTP